ncbi:MAG: hypothetical protein QG599_2175 [Pseudomonadota bacterium]|jgi:hypothetical protein|nr:hypothetical protein [Pseudomonadota bacterium]
MIDLAALRTTLSAALAPVPVQGAIEFAAIAASGLARAPLVWLVPLDERGDTNVLNSGVHQQITVTLGVVYAVRDVRDAQGMNAADSLSALRQSVFTALLNHFPTGATEPISYVSGGLLDFQNAILFWQDQFQTRYTLRAV